jgi:protein SCO1/2
MKKWLIVLLAFIFVLVWGGVYYINLQNEVKPYAFTLQSADGEVHLSDFRGKMPIVYFGYMYCPDICPTTLALSANALRKLSKEDAKKFQLIFISVDPQRDTLKDLKEYVEYFYPYGLGLSGGEKYLKEITKNYGTYYAKEFEDNSTTNYSVAHTTSLYFFDKKGRLQNKIKHPQSSDEIYQILQAML